jgi:hypothetical protein
MLPKQDGTLEICHNSIAVALKVIVNLSLYVPWRHVREGRYCCIQTLSLEGGEWSTYTQVALPLGKEPDSTHWIGDWVAPELVWCLWRREKHLARTRNQTTTPRCPAPKLLAPPALLPQLLFQIVIFFLYDILKWLKPHVKVFETVQWHVALLAEGLRCDILTLFYRLHTTQWELSKYTVILIDK